MACRYSLKMYTFFAHFIHTTDSGISHESSSQADGVCQEKNPGFCGNFIGQKYLNSTAVECTTLGNAS